MLNNDRSDFVSAIKRRWVVIRAVTRVLQRCYKGDTRVLQGCYKDDKRMLLRCYQAK